MMIKKPLVGLVFVLMVSFGTNVRADQAPPEPPDNNPHPPVTELEKKSVALSEVFFKSILTQVAPPRPADIGFSRPAYAAKDTNCLKDKECWMKDKAFLDNVSNVMTKYGKALEWKHAHVIPWSLTKDKKSQALPITPASDAATSPKKSSPMQRPTLPISDTGPKLKEGEHMVHIYVRYDKRESAWYHLDLIMSMDNNNEPVLKYIYTTPMPSNPQEMRPGVVCQIFKNFTFQTSEVS